MARAKMSKSKPWVVFLVGVVLVSCATQKPTITTEDFENGTYQFLGSFNPNPVTLSDGHFETQTELGRESLSLVTHVIGVTNVAVLAQSSGGSGTFYRLGVYNSGDGIFVEQAFTWLGDRVIVHYLGFQDGQIVVVMTRHGDLDPLCCPTKVVIQRYVDENGELALISEELIGTIVGP
jgi:hypothetical protein